jgi:hypothetical protein
LRQGDAAATQNGGDRFAIVKKHRDLPVDASD